MHGAVVVGRLTCSLSLSRPHRLPVYVARIPAAPFCETPNWNQLASDTDALQFWGASRRHYAAKMSLHNDFVESVEAVCQPRTNCMRAARRPVQFSRPLRHLLRERALCAIGIVLHAKVFVDLEQPLLVRDRAQKFFPAGIISKKTRGSGFESPVR